MRDKRFSMGEAISFGWETMKANVGFFIGLLIVAFLVENVLSIMSGFVEGDFPAIAALLSLAGAVVGAVVPSIFAGILAVRAQVGVRGKVAAARADPQAQSCQRQKWWLHESDEQRAELCPASRFVRLSGLRYA